MINFICNMFLILVGYVLLKDGVAVLLMGKPMIATLLLGKGTVLGVWGLYDLVKGEK